MATAVHLVRRSSGEEISVPEGETLVGRGPFLKVTDKRVSRLHAILRLEDGKLSLCPKHKNPCFLKAAGGSSFQVLPKDKWRDLENGDSFSLLPDDLVFSVVYLEKEKEKGGTVTDDGIPAVVNSTDPLDVLFSTEDSNSALTTNHTHKSTQASSALKDNTLTHNHMDSYTTPTIAGNTKLEATVTSSTERTVKTEDNVVKPKLTSTLSGSTGKSRTLPNWLSALGSQESAGKDTVLKKRKPAVKTSSVTREADDDFGSPPPAKKTSTKSAVKVSKPTKALPSPEPSPPKDSSPLAKKAKTENYEESVPSASVVDTRADTKKDSEKPSCPYGASCYRKNPIHFKEFSHNLSISSASASLDSMGNREDDSDKPVCPYGRDCYRKNPVHRREYRHLDRPAKKTGAGERQSQRSTRGKRSILSGDSDDDREPNTYDYNDSFIDDQEDSGDSRSFVGDSDDSDWSPAVKDNSEDVGELLSEAREFISNEKMRRTMH